MDDVTGAPSPAAGVTIKKNPIVTVDNRDAVCSKHSDKAVKILWLFFFLFFSLYQYICIVEERERKRKKRERERERGNFFLE